MADGDCSLVMRWLPCHQPEQGFFGKPASRRTSALRTLALPLAVSLSLGFGCQDESAVSPPAEGRGPGSAAPAVARPATVSPSPAPTARPNVVIVLTDDLRADSLGVSGHPYIETPHVDRLAAEGAYFENSFVVTAVCVPSRASLLTGMYGHRMGVTRNSEAYRFDPEAVPTLPALLDDAGYTTALIGKYHLGPRHEVPPGYDHWVRLASARGHAPSLFTREGMVRAGGHTTDALTDRAVEWIERQADAPFFLLLSFNSPHVPYDPPRRHADLHAGAMLPMPESWRESGSLPLAVRKDGLVVSERRAHIEKAGGLRPAIETTLLGYARMIPAIDDSVGRVVEALRKRGVLDETVIIFTSDNGLLIGEHGLFGKRLPYEESIRVPLILRYPPAVSPGRRVRQQVLNVDLAPTVLSLAGLPVPGAMQGSDVGPLFGVAPVEWRHDWLHVMPRLPSEPVVRGFAVRGRRWKYLRFGGERIEERLFDLVKDPHEREDLSRDPSQRARLAGVRRRLRELLGELEVRSSGR